MMVVRRHGTPYGRCTDGPDGLRCEVCRDARRRAWWKGFELRKAALARDPSSQPHGDVRTYQYHGCRCEACTHASTDVRYTYGYKDKVDDPSVSVKQAVSQRRPKPFGREWLNADA